MKSREGRKTKDEKNRPEKEEIERNSGIRMDKD